MTLKNIFEKPVDRPIEGVIKADDKASLALEVEEYVLTNEVTKRLESFLDAYNNYEGANGVWISGFFGSGKSHLLKILSLLLENRTVEGSNVLDIFLEKCGDNEILRAELKRAVAIPSKSILFNIDQKADIISKTQVDALLAVFVKVFDESCGYYGKQPYIAQFERELDHDNLFEKFKNKFKETASNDWEWGRVRAKRFGAVIDEAYRAVIGHKQDISKTESVNAHNISILDKYRSDYRLSIEDFAEQVQHYIEQQQPNFRLNFFVDEVGQYVADNVKLMTNLQTIAESLATKSRGRAWVIVTAQEDMKDVIGEMNRQQANDFSKIQDRFKNRMKLTSADVAEVIQKRLLLKNEAGVKILSKVYDKEVNNFKTLFDFSDGAQLYRNFANQEHFIHTYPFIPYQFTLFQSAIQNLSMHNAFEGRHSSVGERSMLGVFQQVAVQISDHQTGQLATFDLMYEGIKTALKTQIQRPIKIADENLDNRFAVKVLKALFLVKYIKEFKATHRNLTVLMLESFGQDMEKLKLELTEALNILEHQTYIQRNGDIFEFLTDEEKDVEEEIKHTDIDNSSVADQLSKIIFDNIIKQKKIRYSGNEQDYPFSRKIDGELFGREYELSIHVLTPFYEHLDNEQMLIMQSAGKSELAVVMPPDERMVRDLIMYEKTENYIRHNISTTQQDSVQRILTDKRFQNQERLSSLKQHIHNLLGKAKLYINGNFIDIGGEEPQTRIVKGFQDLITRTYPNLKMLLGFTYTESYISKCLKEKTGTLLGNDISMLSEAEQEMLSVIKANKNSGVRTSLKGLIERFEKKSYGWYYAAILCMLAKLCAAGKVELSFDSNIIEEDKIEKALLNSHGYANLLIEPLIDFTAGQIRSLKEFYEDFFDSPPSSNEAKALGKETSSAFKELIQTLLALASQKSKYPFVVVLEGIIEKIKTFQGKPYAYYLTELHKSEDDLMEIKEKIIDPLKRFINGPQKDIYDSAVKYINSQEPNLDHIQGDESLQIKDILSHPDCFRGNMIQQVKSLVDSLKEKINQQVESERAGAKEKIGELKSRLQGMDEFSLLKEEDKKKLASKFDAAITSLESQTLIAVIRDIVHRFEENEYPQLLSQIDQLNRAIAAVKTASDRDSCNKKSKDSSTENNITTEKTSADNASENIKNDPQSVVEKKIEYIATKSIKIEFDKAWLADETDVDSYLTSLRKAMVKAISEGKRIQI